LPAAEREPLLHGMTEDVAALVLRDNYLQGQALSVAEARGAPALDRQVRLIRELEKSGRLDRALEFLPDETTLASRAAQRRGLTRPELAILLAYSKMSLDTELLASGLPDMPEVAGELCGYFPMRLRERLGPQIPTHPLRREITATIIANDLVNRAGITFVADMRARTGRSAPDIARAYLIVREIFELPKLWAEIETLDNRVPARAQTGILLDIATVVEHAAAWLLRAGRLDIDGEIACSRPGVAALADSLAELLPSGERALFDERSALLATAGAPQALAARAAGVIFLTTALEVGDLARRRGHPVARAARTFYGVGTRFALDELRDAARRLPAETTWQKAAVETLIDDFYALQVELTDRALQVAPTEAADPLASWAASRAAQLAPVATVTAELRAAASPDLAMLVVAGRQLRQTLG
jgi:glutamate dehydrogenase